MTSPEAKAETVATLRATLIREYSYSDPDSDRVQDQQLTEIVDALIAKVREETWEQIHLTSYPHMCRDGHGEVRYKDNEGYLCPACRVREEERMRVTATLAKHLLTRHKFTCPVFEGDDPDHGF